MRTLLNVGNRVTDRWFLHLGMGVVTKVTSALVLVQYQRKFCFYTGAQLLYLQKSATTGC